MLYGSDKSFEINCRIADKYIASLPLSYCTYCKLSGFETKEGSLISSLHNFRISHHHQSQQSWKKAQGQSMLESGRQLSRVTPIEKRKPVSSTALILPPFRARKASSISCRPSAVDFSATPPPPRNLLANLPPPVACQPLWYPTPSSRS